MGTNQPGGPPAVDEPLRPEVVDGEAGRPEPGGRAVVAAVPDSSGDGPSRTRTAPRSPSSPPNRSNSRASCCVSARWSSSSWKRCAPPLSTRPAGAGSRRSRAVDPRIGRRSVPRPGCRAGQDLHPLRQPHTLRRRAPGGPRPAGGMARRPLPRHPGHPGGPTGGGPGPTRRDAPAVPAPGVGSVRRPAGNLPLIHPSAGRPGPPPEQPPADLARPSHRAPSRRVIVGMTVV